MTSKELKELKKFSAQIRVDELEMFRQRGMGHIGGCLSVVELISVLYGKQMKYDPQNPAWEGRDYLVMSKGHAAPTVCAALAEKGFFEKELLLTMDDIGTHIPSHVDRLLTPGSMSPAALSARALQWRPALPTACAPRGVTISTYMCASATGR